MGLITITALLAFSSIMANAGVLSPLPHAFPGPLLARQVVEPVPVVVREADDAYPQYRFAYSVQDLNTGDSKGQEETRDGDVVKGSYSFIEADGSRRTVTYFADSFNGFNAIVHKDSPIVVAPAAPAKIVAV